MLTAAAALTACGGGGSSSPTPVQQTPTPPPVATETVTVTGFVTDMPIPNATVTLTVAGQVFTAANPTGADGSYSVEIQSDDPDAMVLCEAVDATGPTRFSALLDNFAGLQESAGTEGVAADVNITNVTTAQFLLAQDLAADGTIDSMEELQDVSSQIDPVKMLELSAAIKVVVDSVSGVTLPDGFADVQELAQAIVDGTTTFVDDIEVVAPGIIAATIEAVVSDGFATVPFRADKIPGVYVSAGAEDVVVLHADGSGYFAEQMPADPSTGVAGSEQFVEAVTWSITATDALQIDFEGGDTDTVVLLSDAGGVLTMYSSSELSDGTSEEPDTFTVVRTRFDATGFDASTVPGSYRNPDDTESETEFTVFLADGSGYDIDVATGEQDDFFTWEVNPAGELLIVDDGLPDADESAVSDERQTVRLLEGSTADMRVIVAIEQELDSDVVVGVESFPVTYTPEIFTAPMPDVANTALLEGKSYAWSSGFEKGISTFASDGVFLEIYQDYDEVDGPSFGECVAPGCDLAEWFIDDTATLFLTFVEPDGTTSTDIAEVVSGLGEDRMVVAIEDESGVMELGLDRVVPFESAGVVGTWNVFEAGVATTASVTFDADGTGTYSEDGVVDETFDWNVNSSGTLVVALDDGVGAPVWTDNFHRLAGSTDDSVHAFVVFRLDGQLANDAFDPSGPPQVIVEVTLNRQP